MKIAVITGANNGIGYALAMDAIEKEYHVLALDLHTDKLTKNKNLTPYTIDVCQPENFSIFEKWFHDHFKNPPKLWINNAGITALGSFLSISEESFDRVLDVNLRGTIYGTRTALKLQKKQPSEKLKIVNISSMNGIIPAPFMTAYAASKHAVVGFTRSIQLEYEQKKDYGVQFLLVLPGFVATAITESNKDFQLPNWMKKQMETPENTSKEIWKAIQSEKTEVIVTQNGKIIERFYRFFPQLTSKSSRLLIAKDWREALGLDSIDKGD